MIDLLPVEILEWIINYLHLKDVFNLVLVNKELNNNIKLVRYQKKACLNSNKKLPFIIQPLIDIKVPIENIDINEVHKNGTKYDDKGFDINGIHKNGTRFGYDGYDHSGIDIDGYNREGYNKEGHHKKYVWIQQYMKQLSSSLKYQNYSNYYYL